MLYNVHTLTQLAYVMHLTESDLNHTHIIEGGTMITNFRIAILMRYAVAIQAFEAVHGPSSLVLSNVGYGPNNKALTDMGSLHSSAGAFPPKIQEFWDIFETIENDTVAKYLVKLF